MLVTSEPVSSCLIVMVWCSVGSLSVFFLFFFSSVFEFLCTLDGVRMGFRHIFLLCHSFNVSFLHWGGHNLVTPPGEVVKQRSNTDIRHIK